LRFGPELSQGRLSSMEYPEPSSSSGPRTGTYNRRIPAHIIRRATLVEGSRNRTMRHMPRTSGKFSIESRYADHPSESVAPVLPRKSCLCGLPLSQGLLRRVDNANRKQSEVISSRTDTVPGESRRKSSSRVQRYLREGKSTHKQSCVGVECGCECDAENLYQIALKLLTEYRQKRSFPFFLSLPNMSGSASGQAHHAQPHMLSCRIIAAWF